MSREPTMKSCIAGKQCNLGTHWIFIEKRLCKLGKALDIGAPLFLTKHITVFSKDKKE